MVFSSNIFLFLFLPVTLAGNFLLPKRARNVFLLIASLLFYAWGEPRVVLVMIASILFNYGMGLAIDRFCIRRKSAAPLRYLLLILAVAGNLGLLFYYKYYDFFFNNVNRVLGTSIPLKHIPLPIGISFFTFQSLSYVLDLYMGKVKVQRNVLNLGLYVALFPQLIAGPIVRYIDVAREIEDRTITLSGVAWGIRRFAVGLVKKMLIANTVALTADAVFALSTDAISTGAAWVGALCYMVQIYFDFSGYSDMAIGLGRMLGFRFLENFRYPYAATSMTEFWRRWHISMSSWFRDYVYIPLGGSRKGNRYFNLLVVWFLTGLWHGASWNYIAWGLWNCAFLMLEKPLLKRPTYQRIPRAIRWAGTMLIVLLGWVLFREESMRTGLRYLGVMFGQAGTGVSYTARWFLNRRLAVTLLLAFAASMPWKDALLRIPTVARLRGTVALHAALSMATVALLLIGVVLCMTSTYNPFIYFRF